jgi:NADH-quinone oxidoreductase subunit G
MAKMVNIKIDGITLSVPEGTPVVDAAKKAGIDIPVFCYHPKMEPVGMCRQCLVELGRPMIDRASGKPVLEADGSPKIQFMPKLETACTNTASEGMVILTSTPKVKAAQKEVLELLLTSHPLDCPVCDKGGECPLQNLTMAHGPNDSRFLYDDKQRLDKRVPLGDLIFLDRERCIQCARCIRFQDDIAGEPVLAFHERGRRTDVVTFSEPGFDSIFSGNTTDICPVGALTTADFRFGARPWELNNAASVCSQCAVGCNITFNVRREVQTGGGYVVKRVLPRQNEQVNEIWMCDKGRFAGYHYTESDSRLSADPADFESTLSRAAEALAAAKADGVVLAGGRLSNEDLFNLKQLAAALGAQTYLYTGMGGGEYTTACGLTAGSNLGALTKGDTILVVASDLYNEAPIWHLRVKAAAKRGAMVIVAAGRATKLDQFAAPVVRYAYGDEVETVKKLAGNEAIASAANLVVFFGSDGLGLAGTQALAAECAELVKGRAGKVNNGLVGVWPTPNAQGAWELGFRPAENLAAMLKGKTVYVAAADPAGDDPQLAEALKSARIVIAQDILETETTRLASIVLPAAAYTEREGTYTSAERRVQRFNPAVPARLGARADYVLTAAIARKCGVELEGRSPLLVMNQIAASEPVFAGISYARLAEVTEQWPDVGNGDLYYGGTSYENTQGLGAHLALSAAATSTSSPVPAVLAQAVQRPAAIAPGNGFPKGELVAVPVTKLYDAGATVSPAKLLESHIGPAGVVLNPTTAGKLGVGNGGQAKVSLNNLEAEVQVHLDESLADGVLLVYRSFGIPIFDPTAATLTVAEKA